ncbi:hypothetical protein GCM10011331_07240 [Flavimobilis marinus]|uniref:Carboxypeptidase regulatory-like domain-containing protein n=1 Tax=Flavimobilis marinus TaxID=285351 RepID=A0A1I2CUE3_9MICO|nr:carboxypeptidase regulatory-like domain-containing protein [Flavimobilis marinus]GHG46894.1 hypothetical protein GCM10011331_07240 [Flavimobilis marinus]SFE71946.1 Carboxypeptidase regulatory-like domain-containing protein [Flavimobilis marinus]
MPQTVPAPSLPRAAQAAIAALMALALLLAPALVPDARAAGLTVTGTLVAPDGSPRADFTVKLSGANGDTLSSTTSAKDGTFTLAQPAAGTQFYVVAWSQHDTSTRAIWIGSGGAQAWDQRTAPAPYKARSGSSIATGTHTLAPAAGFDVTVHGGPAAAYASVEVQRLDGERVWEGDKDETSLREGFIPGRYLVMARSDGRVAAPVEVALRSGDLAQVSLTLSDRSASPTLSGVVTLDGKPLANRSVEAVRKPTSWRDAGGPRPRYTRTDKTGRFTLEQMAPGTYEVSATIKSAVRGNVRTVVVGSADAKADLTMQRRTDLGKVSGRFTVAGKQARGEVTLVRGREVVHTTTLSKGRYVFRNVVPSTYHLTYLDEKANRYYTTRITVKASQHRALKPKKVTRKTVTLAGTHQDRWAPTMASAQQGRIEVDRLRGKRYRATHVIPATLRIEVLARDDSLGEYNRPSRYTPRVYSKVKVTKSRTLNLKDGGLGGTVTASPRYASSGLPVHTTYIFMACQGATCAHETSAARAKNYRPAVTGLESESYTMVLWEAEQGADTRWEQDEPWKNPYYLEPVTTKVRAVKGKTVDLGVLDVKVLGGL